MGRGPKVTGFRAKNEEAGGNYSIYKIVAALRGGASTDRKSEEDTQGGKNSKARRTSTEITNVIESTLGHGFSEGKMSAGEAHPRKARKKRGLPRGGGRKGGIGQVSSTTGERLHRLVGGARRLKGW